jgi:hypothetical protein
MENITTINDCVEFKNELHKKLYVKSGAKNFNEYIKYINSTYSDNKTYSGKSAVSIGVTS